MIELYSDKKYLPANKYKVISNNDTEFNALISVKDLNDIDRRLMKIIEGAEIINENSGTCTGKYGIMRLEDISTGLKTLLNIRYFLKNRRTDIVVDITDAGPNIIPYIFKTVDGTGFKIILRHLNILGLPDFKVRLNGNETYDNMFDLENGLSKC